MNTKILILKTCYHCLTFPRNQLHKWMFDWWMNWSIDSKTGFFNGIQIYLCSKKDISWRMIELKWWDFKVVWLWIWRFVDPFLGYFAWAWRKIFLKPQVQKKLHKSSLSIKENDHKKFKWCKKITRKLHWNGKRHSIQTTLSTRHFPPPHILSFQTAFQY